MPTVTYPTEPDSRIRLETAPGRKAHSIRFYPPDEQGGIPALGKVSGESRGYSVALACVDPLEFFGDVFLRLLREEGAVPNSEATITVRRFEPGS